MATFLRRCSQCPRILVRALRGDRGDGPVSTAILAPAILALVFIVVQSGLALHARNVAASGAQVGYEHTRTFDGSASSGQAAAHDYLTEVAPDMPATVRASRTADNARVDVSIEILQIVPIFPLPDISAHADGPVERVTQP